MTKKSPLGLCSIDDCAYVGSLVRKMCRRHYYIWLKANTSVSHETDKGMICTKCKRDKALSLFPADKKSKNGRNSRCSACVNAYQRDWASQDRESFNKNARERYIQSGGNQSRTKYDASYRHKVYLANGRSSMLKAQYGINEQEFRSMLESQNNCCAICGGEDSRTVGRQMSVDHCHRTGVNRGILCASCNKGIGMFYDDPARLMAAASYLQKYVDTPHQGGSGL